MFLLDTHVHTAEVSVCGHVPAREMVKRYRRAGYDGIVVTDHYHQEYFKRQPGDWRSKAERYLRGYRAAKAAGDRLGLRVYLGMEWRNEYAPNDYLIFGIDEGFVLENPALYRYSLRELRPLIEENHLLLYQAHPFRPHMTLPERDGLLDGVEAFNGNPRHHSRNELALSYAKRHRLLISSGSDAHEVGDVGIGGMLLDREPADERELVSLLPSGRIKQWQQNKANNEAAE